MLHSYSGSPEDAARFLVLPGGLGRRIYFSFSSAVSAAAAGKLAARVAAVPDDRLLLESDQVPLQLPIVPSCLPACLSDVLALLVCMVAACVS